MKIKRYKKVHKNLSFYTNNYGFHQPYQILIDGTFCFEALKNQINIQDQLAKYFHADLKLLTTQCVIMETEKLGKAVFGAMKIVKQFGVHKCGHQKSEISGSACLLSMIRPDNKNRYFIATQDRDLQDKIRTVPAAPLVYLHLKTPNLERPSEVTLVNAKNRMLDSFSVREVENKTIKKLKEISGIPIEVEKSVMKRKKKKKGANPLSCKKKKKKDPKEKDGNIKKRSRNRIRIPKHLKEVLHAQLQTEKQ